MRNISIWLISILFFSTMVYFGWNIILTPYYLMGETMVVEGKIVDVFPSEEVQSFSRRVKYVYTIDDNYYFDFKKLGTGDPKQVIGNSVKIVCSVNYPKWNKVEKFQNEFSNSKGVKFYSNRDNGYIEMLLINGIFKYKEQLNGGEIADQFVGEYAVYNDSIQFKYYQFDEKDMLHPQSRTWLYNHQKRNQFVDSETKRIYKRINKRR